MQDFRASTKMLAEFQEVFGSGEIGGDKLRPGELRPAGTVTWAWRERHVLVPARIDLRGEFVALDEPGLVDWLEGELSLLLASKGITNLDISALRSRDRSVSQHISRTIYDQGAAGLCFRSNTDDELSYVCFEGRARLEQDGEPVPCTEDITELLQVCSDYDLILRRGPLDPAVVTDTGRVRRFLRSRRNQLRP